jgi:prolyl 4-hydroxylase
MEIIPNVIAVLVIIICIWILVFRIRKGCGYADETDEWDPPFIVESVLTPEECQHIIDKANPLFSPSIVMSSPIPDPTMRTSETAWIDKTDPVAQKVIAKVLELTGKTGEYCESLQVVRYKPGTFYNAHHDSCCDDSETCLNFSKEVGQRIATLLIYLNSEFTNGETHFPNYNDLKFKPNTGSAIFFRPMGKNVNKCHPKALHAGLQISTGTKYVCNVWVRENKFHS